MSASFFPDGMTVTPERAVPKRNLTLLVLHRGTRERRTPPAWRYAGHGWAASVTAPQDGILRPGVRQTRHDVYACGRQGQIFTQHFARDNLPRWLDGLSAAGLPAPLVCEQHWLRAQVRQALEQLADPAALARRPLLALSAVTTIDGLREQLTDAIYTRAGSDTPLHIQAGQLLQNRYLRR